MGGLVGVEVARLQDYAVHGGEKVLAKRFGEGAEMPMDDGGIFRAAHVVT